jgi:hypothetical protein
MSTVTITRSSEWNNSLRKIAIYIDGLEAGTISNGETKLFKVPPGFHRIHARVGWCGSKELPFTNTEEEKKYFRLSGFKYSAILAPISITILVLHLILKRTAGIDYLIWLVLPFFLIMVYYVSFGRNDYLTLKETGSW